MKNTLISLQKQKQMQDKITMVAAYDFFSAKALDEAGINAILVGDSLAMVVLGHEDTLSVSMDEMLIFTKAVSRAAKNAFILADMPFASYQISKKQALKNATRFIKEGRANGVKIEGEEEILPIIKAFKQAGIPVVAHLGLTPQSVNVLGGYKVQAKDLKEAQTLLDNARKAEEAGAFMVLLECVPSLVAKKVSQSLKIPVIGIGAGKDCDGQVLVWHDLLGINTGYKPKFVKRFGEFKPEIALKNYIEEVKNSTFPSDEFSFSGGENLEKLY